MPSGRLPGYPHVNEIFVLILQFLILQFLILTADFRLIGCIIDNNFIWCILTKPCFHAVLHGCVLTQDDILPDYALFF